jgi:non-specific serine/threonine protein kinase
VRGLQDLERGAARPQRETRRRLAAALALPAAQRVAFEAAGAPAPRRRAALRATAAAGGRPRHNLPLQLSSLVGREAELAAVTRRLATARLLTLTGPGGVGKTRLALAAAEASRHAYAGGVWLVALDALADPALLPYAVAQAVGVREEPQRPLLATLADALSQRCLLLVLDSCEHLLDACAALAAALLRACPGVTVLATSRAPLAVAGEVVWQVPPLALPDGAPGLPAAPCAAVRLFVERAAPTAFRLTGENAPVVGEICRRLDGLPLAIELAAARVRHLAPAALLARLEAPPGRLPLLTGGPRDAPPRQRTLRDAIAWSYGLLPPAEQALFSRLGVFAGGFTLAAAAVVGAAAGGPEPDASDVLEGISALVDASLAEQMAAAPAAPADGGGAPRPRRFPQVANNPA